VQEVAGQHRVGSRWMLARLTRCRPITALGLLSPLTAALLSAFVPNAS